MSPIRYRSSTRRSATLGEFIPKIAEIYPQELHEALGHAISVKVDEEVAKEKAALDEKLSAMEVPRRISPLISAN